MSFLRTLSRGPGVTGLSSRKPCLLKNGPAQVLTAGDGRKGIKTTDTAHPKPVYNEDEKILKRVMEERQQQEEDLPIGMANPYEKPRKKCILCEHNVTPNFKNIKLISQFVSPYTGMMYERHVTGLCKRKHDEVEREYRIAENLGLMSNYIKLVEFLKDPKLCDPERPVKPHKY